MTKDTNKLLIASPPTLQISNNLLIILTTLFHNTKVKSKKMKTDQPNLLVLSNKPKLSLTKPTKILAKFKINALDTIKNMLLSRTKLINNSLPYKPLLYLCSIVIDEDIFSLQTYFFEDVCVSMGYFVAILVFLNTSLVLLTLSHLLNRVVDLDRLPHFFEFSYERGRLPDINLTHL